MGKTVRVITPEFGSYVYLGEMITNLPFVPDTPMEDQCGTCNKCIEACPTGALVQGGQINAQACISFLTQTKGMIAEEFHSKMGNRLYGCDSCQTACPVNKGKDFHFHPEVEPEPEIAKPLLKPILKLSNRQFKEKFGHVSGAWRGKNPIQRNAMIALAHFKDETALEDLVDLLNHDPRPMIRGTAAWSVKIIAGNKSTAILKKALTVESDDAVKAEIEKALNR